MSSIISLVSSGSEVLRENEISQNAKYFLTLTS